MRHLLDKILLDKKNKMIARLITAICLALSIVIIGHVYLSVPKMEENKQLFNHYFTLLDSIQLLQKEVSDSALENSKKMIDKGVLIGWDNAAIWLENIRTLASVSNIDITYQIDSLVSFPEGGEKFFKMPVRIDVIPIDGKFETVMEFVQDICSDTLVNTCFENIEFTGDAVGLSQVHIKLTNWIRL